MILKVLDWNIGGARIREPGADPNNPHTFTKVNLQHVIDVIQEYSADIVILQEIHWKKSYDQIKELAGKLEYPHFVSDDTSESQLEDDSSMGQGILSIFPIASHHVTMFMNPAWKGTGLKGENITSHDKGVSKYILSLPNNIELSVNNVHLLPFHRFGKDPMVEEVASLRKDIDEKLQSDSEYCITAGDFNYDNQSLQQFLPKTSEGMKDLALPEPPRPNGKYFDHILYRGMTDTGAVVHKDALTDHYPIYTEFEI